MRRTRFDQIDRLIEKVLPEGPETYAYDPVGRQVFASNEHVSEITLCDPDGRLTSKSDTARGFSRTLNYDPAGNLEVILDSYGRSTRRTYDALNRVTTIEDHRGGTYRFGYDPAGQLTDLERPNGIHTTWDYDAAGRVARIEHVSSGSGTAVASFEYLGDAVGNPLQEIQTRAGQSATTEYAYDAKNQLISAEVTATTDPDLKGFRSIRYTYDPAGNRLSRTVDGLHETYEYNAANELVSVNGLALTYDFDGNLIREELSPKKARVYTFDSENNLTGIALDVGARSRRKRRSWTYAYGYSPAGLKVTVEKEVEFDRKKHRFHHKWWYPWRWKHLWKKARKGKRWRRGKGRHHGPEDHHGRRGFVRLEDRFWMGGSVVEDRRARDSISDEFDPHRIRERNFLRGPGGVLAELRSRLKNETRREQPGKDQVYLTDVLGSTIATAANDGDIQRWLGYSPFGEMKPDWEDTKTSGHRWGRSNWWKKWKLGHWKRRDRDKSTTFTYTGLLRERVPGDDDQIYSAAFRHLRPSLGRWMKADSAGAVDGPNLYRYVKNRPLRFRDPSGLVLVVPKSESRGRNAVDLLERAPTGKAILDAMRKVRDRTYRLEVTDFVLLQLTSFPGQSSVLTVEQVLSFRSTGSFDLIWGTTPKISAPQGPRTPGGIVVQDAHLGSGRYGPITCVDPNSEAPITISLGSREVARRKGLNATNASHTAQVYLARELAHELTHATYLVGHTSPGNGIPSPQEAETKVVEQLRSLGVQIDEP